MAKASVVLALVRLAGVDIREGDQREQLPGSREPVDAVSAVSKSLL